MLIRQTHLKTNIRLYLLINAVKPNFTPSGSQKLHSKALGFTRFLMAVASLAKVMFFPNLAGFGGIRSTQPTGLLTQKHSQQSPSPEYSQRHHHSDPVPLHQMHLRR